MDGFPLSKDQLLDALKANVPPKFLDLNIKAFELGYANFKN
jgi:Pyruvate/2-oxoacid:ferredoxin oxidoreductase gamma subunit